MKQKEQKGNLTVQFSEKAKFDPNMTHFLDINTFNHSTGAGGE